MDNLTREQIEVAARRLQGQFASKQCLLWVQGKLREETQISNIQQLSSADLLETCAYFSPTALDEARREIRRQRTPSATAKRAEERQKRRIRVMFNSANNSTSHHSIATHCSTGSQQVLAVTANKRARRSTVDATVCVASIRQSSGEDTSAGNRVRGKSALKGGEDAIRAATPQNP